MFTAMERLELLDIINHARDALANYQPTYWIQHVEARYCLDF